MGLQFARLVTFSWTQSERAIERLWSGFDEPEKSHAHVEMLWSGYFHKSTVERSVSSTFFLASTSLLILLAMQHSRGEVHAPKKSYTRHPRFPTHFAGHHVLISPGWRIPMFEDIERDSDIFPKNSRRKKIKYDRIELLMP